MRLELLVIHRKVFRALWVDESKFVLDTKIGKGSCWGVTGC